MGSPIIITGMHRSGTSLLASMLQEAGITLGKHLKAAGPFNSRGYFEDVDFIDFHEQVLQEAGTTMYLQHAVPGPRTTDQEARAKSLLKSRAEQAVWGWKDPRTSLFLDFWNGLLPDATFIFIFRRPSEVVDSLRRRRDPMLYRQFPGAPLLERFGFPRFRGQAALGVWKNYNRHLLDFAAHHPGRCQFVAMDALKDQVQDLVAGINAELASANPDLASLIDERLLTSVPRSDIERLCDRDPETQDLLNRLQAQTSHH
ncbi:MAG: sulfotransferase [Phycisphaerales bacterium]|nr:sulfotransferase [Phycisphaerales bacterium]